ncbi:GNAT family N-acetyltransferase [Saccharopolyspora taberi]|uniref:GNAT family N-acetyltransferase n=1 Tax=Saccharopolyspora taberi TaxID=60895 RepID=A0ABN3VDV7_9PSEU
MLFVDDATEHDLPLLTAMVRASSAYRGEYRPMVADASITAGDLAVHLVRVARDGDRPLGFYLLMTPGRGTDGEGELDYLFVDNDQQGRGLGRLLVADLRERAAERGLRRLHIVSHPPSEPFYLSLGARRVGEVGPYGAITWARPHLVLDV